MDNDTKSNHGILEDFIRVASSTTRSLSGIRQDVEHFVLEKIERCLDKMDLVRRDEFEAVKAMAAKARAEQERLEQRIAQLEALLLDEAANETSLH